MADSTSTLNKQEESTIENVVSPAKRRRLEEIEYFISPISDVSPIMPDHDAIDFYEKRLNEAVKKGDRKGEGEALRHLGETYVALGNHPKGIEYLNKNLVIVREIGDKVKENLAYGKIGEAYYLLGEYNNAMIYYEKSRNLSLEMRDKDSEQKANNQLGVIYAMLNYHEKAIKCFESQLHTALKADDKLAEGQVYCNIGNVYFAIGRYREAWYTLRRSLQIAHEIDDAKLLSTAHVNIAHTNYVLRNDLEDNLLGRESRLEEIGYFISPVSDVSPITPDHDTIDFYQNRLNEAVKKGDRKGEGEALRHLGETYVALGNHPKGIEYLNKNLVVVREIGDKVEENLAYGKIGEAYCLLGEYNNAMIYYEKSRNLSLEMRDKDSEQKANNQLGVIYARLNYHEKAINCFESQLHTAEKVDDKLAEGQVCCNIGNVYFATGRYREAFDTLQKSLQTAHEIDDAKLLSTAHVNIAHAYYVLGNGREDIKHCEESARIALESGDKTSEAMAYHILVSIAENKKDYSTMMENAKKHLEVVEQCDDNKHEKLIAYYDRGKASFFVGQYKDAQKYLDKSLNFAIEIGDRESQGRAYQYLGYVYEKESSADSLKKAIECHEQHLKLSNKIGDKSGVGKANRNLGALFLSSYLKMKSIDYTEKYTEYKKKAEDYFKESLRSYDSLFQDLGEEDEHKINVIDTFINTHKLLVELYIETGELNKALLVSERERGRALQDILEKKYRLEKSKTYNYDFNDYDNFETIVLSSDSCILFFSDMMKMSRSNFEQQMGTWVLDLQTHVVSFYRNELRTIKAMQLEERNLDEEVQESKDILVDLVEKSYQTMSVQRSANCEDRSFNMDVCSAAESVPSSPQDSEKRCVYDEELNENYLEVLYDTLITPVQHKLTKKEIVIIPEGPLFKVPFAALRDPNTKLFLSDTKRLRIAPSLTTLKILRESAESHCMSGALIVGDPDVSGIRLFRGKEISLYSLPNARLEAETIAKVLGVKAITGTDATKQAITERLREGVAVIHFAAHGCADSGEIVLCPSITQPTRKTPDEDDYLLTIKEVQEIGLRARLVVLSCCHSGRGEIKSEGVIGMSRAFLAAGALAVVASLWAVDDEGTRVFMELFYTHLKEGKTASTSLQQAMKEMRNMPHFEEPMYWAPFVLIGDDVTIKI